MSLRERLQDAGSRKIHEREVEGYGTVHIREMSVSEAEALAKVQEDGLGSWEQVRRSLAIVANALMEEGGEPVFGPDEQEQGVEILMGQSINDARALINATVAVNGLSDEAVKDEVGNSESTPG